MKYFKIVTIESEEGRVFNRIEEEITADQALEMIAGDTAAAPAVLKVKEKTGGGCPECGRPKRHKKNCSRRETAAPVGKKERKRPTCKNCGEVGHLQKTCPNRSGRLPADTHRGGAISVGKFEQVKIAQSHNVPADVIARELHVDLKEVNKAIVCKKYADYLEA